MPTTFQVAPHYHTLPRIPLCPSRGMLPRYRAALPRDEMPLVDRFHFLTYPVSSLSFGDVGCSFRPPRKDHQRWRVQARRCSEECPRRAPRAAHISPKRLSGVCVCVCVWECACVCVILSLSLVLLIIAESSSMHPHCMAPNLSLSLSPSLPPSILPSPPFPDSLAIFCDPLHHNPCIHRRSLGGQPFFQVGGMIGQGSFATVHKAKHVASGKNVALKVRRRNKLPVSLHS
jgi:hypothetical protein